MKTKCKSLTLMELLVSLVLFTIVVMALSVFDIFGHFHSITSDRRAGVQNELSLVLEHITKTVTGFGSRGGAIGDVNNPPFIPDSNGQGFSIRWDNGQGINYASDGWVGYAQSGNVMYYYGSDTAPDANPRTTAHSGTSEVIANHLLPSDSSVSIGNRGFELTTPVTVATGGTPATVTSYNACTIVLRARWFPGSNIAIDNPQAQMQITITAPSTSIN